MRASDSQQSKSPKLEIGLLGRFEVLRDGEPIPEAAWGRRKTKTLLKVLLTDPGRLFTQDQLVEALFEGENPKSAVNNLYSRVSELRHALEPGLKRGNESQFILRQGQGYLFDATACADLDTVAFQRVLDEGQPLAEEKDWSAAAERLEEALALYRGELMPEDRYEDWAESARTQLRGQYLDSMMQLTECYVQLGRLRQAISCCQQILAMEPHRESIIQKLMEYQAQAGQRAAALETYKEGERALRHYLDVEPSAVIRALRDELIRDESREDLRLDPRRVAVLPLQHYSTDLEDEYFTDGLTEELIGCLAKIKDLRVVARTSMGRYKDTREPIRQIARELNVGTVLEGSVRKAKDRLRISIQMIDAVSEDHVWSAEYDQPAGDALHAQCEVGQEVAKALRLELLPEEQQALAETPIVNPKARSLYLKGRRLFGKRTMGAYPQAIDCFQRALAIDPGYVPAMAGMANCYSHAASGSEEGYAKSLAMIRKALEIDPTSAESHAGRAAIAFLFESDHELMQKHLKEAIRLDPSYGQAHDWLAQTLMFKGRFEEAAAEGRKAVELGPLTPQFLNSLARILLSMNRFQDALSYLEASRETDPNSSRVYLWLAAANQILRQWSEVEEPLRQLEEVTPRHPEGMQARALNYLYTGNVEDSLAAIRLAVSMSPRYPNFKAEMARILYCARRYDEAVRFVKKAMSECPRGATGTGMTPFHYVLGQCYERLGLFDQALDEFGKSKHPQSCWTETMGNRHALVDAAAGIVYVRSGHPEKAHVILSSLLKKRGEQHMNAATAILHFYLEEIDEGFAWLNRAVDQYDRFLLTIKTHPWFDIVRDDPRFGAVLQRMKLAD